MKITVIRITEWNLVYVNNDLYLESDDVTLEDISQIAGSSSFSLAVIQAHNTVLDKTVTSTGLGPTLLFNAIELVNR